MQNPDQSLVHEYSDDPIPFPGKLVAIEYPRGSHEKEARFPDGKWLIVFEQNPELAPVAVLDASEDQDPQTRIDAGRYAHLFAASRDLLEALEGVLRVADRQTVEFDAARAAIARATNPESAN